MTIKRKGIIGIPIVIVFALSTVTCTYFVNLISTNTKITTAKEELNTEISGTNERVSSMERGFEMMLENQKTMMEDIKSLIKKEI